MVCDFIDLLSSDEEATTASLAQKHVLKPTSRGNEQCASLRSEPLFKDPQAGVDKRSMLFEDDYNSPPSKRSRTNQALPTTNENISWEVDGFGVLDDDDDDPIVFTSSAHQHVTTLDSHCGKSRSRIADISSDEFDDSLPEDILGLRRQSATKSRNRRIDSYDQGLVASTTRVGCSGLSDTTKALLASLSQSHGYVRRDRKGLVKTMSTASGDGIESQSTSGACLTLDPSDQEEPSQTKAGKDDGRQRLTPEEKAKRLEQQTQAKEAKARDRQREKERKAKEKEGEHERKRLQKEEKAKQKQKDAEIAEVNKAKLDKKDSTPEMIVDLPATIHGQKLDSQAREFLKNLDVEVSQHESLVPNIVRFRRKVKARWSSKEGLWEPLQKVEVDEENHIICLMPAVEFIDMATTQEGIGTVDAHVKKLRTSYPDCVIIYLIESLSKKMRDSKTAANRRYQNEVINQGQTEDSNASQTSKRKKAPVVPVIIDEDVIEDALLRLQVMNGCLIHHTASYVETAEWIATFTQHISTIPYK